jgi:phosphonate transport system ATP-binding protein
LKPLSIEIAAGSMVGIIGRSGAGKSTLLRLTNRLIEPSRGSIFYGDLDVTQLRGRRLRAWRARAAMIFQQFNLVGRLDVLTNVLIGRLARGVSLATLLRQFSAADRARAILVLERLGLADFALQRADRLSGGQQQRVAIARAMVQEPAILLADEPIASLDLNTAKTVMEDVKRIHQGGVTVLCSLHDLDTAREYCDRLIGLAAGEVVFDGPPGKLDAAAVRAIYGEEGAS